jgi:hypothetical protein
MPAFIVETTQISIETYASNADQAVEQVLAYERAPFSAFKAVWAQDVTPEVSSKYGAPMGRQSDRLDPDGTFKASIVDLDDGGYDNGGAYWGLRPGTVQLYAVQDGAGNIAFVDAISGERAIEDAIS